MELHNGRVPGFLCLISPPETVSILMITSWTKIVAGAPAVVSTVPPSGRNRGRREAKKYTSPPFKYIFQMLSLPPTINWIRTQVHSST